MNTSQTHFFSEISAGHDGPTIPDWKRAYFQGRLRNRMYELILEKFAEEQKNGLTQAKLARRIGRKPDVVNRWFAGPSNLTSDTMSDLLLGICGEEMEVTAFDPTKLPVRNYSAVEWITEKVSNPKFNIENTLPRANTSSSSTTLAFQLEREATL